MNDWKGKRVDIEVWFNWSDLVYQETGVILDTDTLNDLLDKYDPELYSFDIGPTVEAEND